MGKYEENITFEEILNQSFKKVKVGTIVTGTIIEINSKNEIFVDIGYKADGIVPKSEYSVNEDDDPHNEFKPGDKIKVVILKLNDGQGNVLMSYKKARERIEKEEKKSKVERFWDEIEVGKKYKGTVTSLSDYGAFIDVGGFQGLLHISEIAWGRNQNPREILKVGQEIDVKVKELDKENKRFKLSYEKKGPNPWNKVGEKYHVGDVVQVKVSKLMPFGAFVELEKGIEGLVHISQICERKISKPEEELIVGKKVNAKIIDIDLSNKKIELSIRELEGTSREYKET